jgi:hypothetical protein
VKRYNKISAELVVDSREVLEARPRTSQPPPCPVDGYAEGGTSQTPDGAADEDDERWDNSPCTD